MTKTGHHVRFYVFLLQCQMRRSTSLLTKQHIWFNISNLKIPVIILNISTCSFRLCCFLNHLYSGTSPCLNNPPAAQSRYSGALFSQFSFGEGFYFLCKRLHHICGEDVPSRNVKAPNLSLCCETVLCSLPSK